MNFSGLRVDAWMNGVRDDSYDKKDKETGKVERVERYVADVYIPGLGAAELPVTPQEYGALLGVKPNTEATVPVRLEIANVVIPARVPGGRSFARRELQARFGNLELKQASAKAG